MLRMEKTGLSSPKSPWYCQPGDLIWRDPCSHSDIRNGYNINRICTSFFFFFYQGFLSQPFTNRRTAGEGGGHFFLTPHYHFHQFHRQLDISRAITAESLPLHMG